MSNSRNPIGLFNALAELKKEGIINQDNFEMRFIGPLPLNVSSMILEKK